jgi:PAS domain S-box-containing protein
MENVLNPSKTQFEAMIAIAQGTTGLLDPGARVLYLSGPLLGYSPDEMRGRSLLEGVDLDDLPHAKQSFSQCLERPREQIRSRLRKIHNDGSVRVVEAVMVNKLSDPEIGAIVLQCWDITEKTAVEVVSDSDLRFLEKICFVLSESLEYEAAIHKVVDLTVGHLGDWCSVDLIEDGSIQGVAAAHSNPNLLKLAEKVIETGETVCVPQLTTEQLASMDSKDREILGELDICSYVATPLKARERVLGVLSATRSRESRQYDSRELALIKDVATQISLHIDKARLFREAQRAQKQSELLTEITTLLAESFDSANILQRLARSAVQSFSEYCFVHRFAANGQLYRAAGAHADPELCETVNRLLDEQEIGQQGQEYIRSIIDKNVPSLTRDGGHLASRMDEGVYKEMIHKLAPHSWIIAPLVARGNRLGVFCWHAQKRAHNTQTKIFDLWRNSRGEQRSPSIMSGCTGSPRTPAG